MAKKDVMKQLREINVRNNLLKSKFYGDDRFVRIHKRIDEENNTREMTQPYIISKVEMDRVEALNHIRRSVDELLFNDSQILHNEEYFSREVMQRVTTQLKAMRLNTDGNRSDRLHITRLIIKEYTQQYQNYKFRSA